MRDYHGFQVWFQFLYYCYFHNYYHEYLLIYYEELFQRFGILYSSLRKAHASLIEI